MKEPEESEETEGPEELDAPGRLEESGDNLFRRFHDVLDELGDPEELGATEE